MASAYKTLYRAYLPNSATTLYTAPSGVIIKHISIVNTDSADRTCSLYRNGTTNDYLFTVPLMVVPAGGMVEQDMTMSLEASGTIAGLASVASKLTIIICGDEES